MCQETRGVAVMLGLAIKIFPNCAYSHTPDRPRKVAAFPHRRSQGKCDARLAQKVRLDRLNHIRDDVIRAQTQQTAKMIRMSLSLQQMVVMTTADFG
jgi:hypothetical protein